MALSVDWPNYEILVARADMTLIQSNPTEIRQLDTMEFHYYLRALGESEEGRPFYVTHDHNKDEEVGGINLADVVKIRDPYTITFEDGQYAVYLLGSNNNILEKTNKNSVSVNPSNSAGLVTSAGIEALEYGGRVTIDLQNITGNASSGQLYPKGTLRVPSNNIADALQIAASRGYREAYFISNANLNSSNDFDDFLITGFSHVHTELVLADSASFVNTIIQSATISGTLDGKNEVHKCIIMNLNYVYGHIHDSSLGAKITLAGSNDAFIGDCKRLDINVIPEIDMGGSGQDLVMTNYSGAIKISNLTGANKVGIGLDQGVVMLMSTVTAGAITVGGIGRLVDESGNHIPTGTWNGGVTITNNAISDETTAEAVLNAVLLNYQTAGSVGEAITDAAAGGNPWEQLMSTSYNINTFGWLMKKLLAKIFGVKL